LSKVLSKIGIETMGLAANKNNKGGKDKNKNGTTSKKIPFDHKSLVPLVKGLSSKDPKEVMISRNVLSNAWVGMPERHRVTLAYVDHYTHTHSSGALQRWDIRGNSCFDPDYTYTGHSPQSFTELAYFYQRYKVISSYIMVTVTSLTANIPIVVTVLPCRELTTYTDINNPSELGLADMKVVPDIYVPGTVIQCRESSAKMFGVSNLSDEDYGANVTGNPSKVWYYSIMSQTANQASSTSCTITLRVLYDVEFYTKQSLS
jgi:hypothetical protein